MQEVAPINPTDIAAHRTRVINALGAEDSSVRLRAALAAGSDPDPTFLETLIERCAVEPDFFVRDMLSWALIRLPPEITLPRIRTELDAECNQARSQALHTLSKINDKGTWAWITRDMLRDADDQVARTAWRVAVLLVPGGAEKGLAEELVLQLGRGDPDVQLSLSRALVGLGEVIRPVLASFANHPDPDVAAHARATEALRRNPEAGFAAAIEEAKRTVRLGPDLAAEAEVATAGSRPDEPVEPAEDQEVRGC